MIDSSGFGVKVILTASGTFPAGLVLTQFTDNASSIETEDIELAQAESGVNGDLIVWQKAQPILISVNLIAGGEDDRNMQLLVEANRAALGKIPVKDEITLVKTLPSGSVYTYAKGTLVSAPIGTSVEGSGRLKANTYKFKFQEAFGI